MPYIPVVKHATMPSACGGMNFIVTALLWHCMAEEAAARQAFAMREQQILSACPAGSDRQRRSSLNTQAHLTFQYSPSGFGMLTPQTA